MRICIKLYMNYQRECVHFTEITYLEYVDSAERTVLISMVAATITVTALFFIGGWVKADEIPKLVDVLAAPFHSPEA
jgi:hypothetical protein